MTFRDFLIPRFEHPWFINLILILLWIVVGILLLAVAYGIFYLIDSVGREEKLGMAKVISHSYQSDGYTTTYIYSGQSMIPITNYYPESYYLNLKVGDKSDSVGVTSSFYLSTPDGAELQVKYQEGRLSNQIYITEIKP